MTQDSLSGSTARNPDLDWSQIRETILMPVSYTHLDVYKRQLYREVADCVISTEDQPVKEIVGEILRRLEAHQP